eukprot:GHVO01049189.1.p1 GENE.GHVO01049189.1~~GHVO01049189.1.p1  ORF type:complete len:293 (+),score=43.14 GHVO01049189.1:136-1014(+)
MIVKILAAAIPVVITARNLRNLEKVPEGMPMPGENAEGSAKGRFYINAYKDKNFAMFPDLDIPNIGEKLAPLGYVIEPIFDKELFSQIPGGTLTKEYRFEPIIPEQPLRASAPRYIPQAASPVREAIKDTTDIDLYKTSRIFLKSEDLPNFFDAEHWDLDQLHEKLALLGEPLMDKFHIEPIMEKIHDQPYVMPQIQKVYPQVQKVYDPVQRYIPIPEVAQLGQEEEPVEPEPEVPEEEEPEVPEEPEEPEVEPEPEVPEEEPEVPAPRPPMHHYVPKFRGICGQDGAPPCE